MAISFLSVQNFISKHGGRQALLDLVERLNGPGYQRDIADDFNMDPSQLSRFLKDNFDVVYVLKPEVRELLDNYEQVLRDRYESQRRTEARVLRIAATRRKDSATGGQ